MVNYLNNLNTVFLLCTGSILKVIIVYLTTLMRVNTTTQVVWMHVLKWTH